VVHQDLCIFSSASLSQVNRGRETHHIELPSKEWSSAVLRLSFIRRMVLEELTFGLEGDADLLVCFNVSLPSVHDRNVTQSQRNDPSSQNVDDVSASIPISKCQSGGESRNGGKSRAYIRSILVRTPIVLVPSGSTSLANFNPSEFARSWLPGVTARMIQLGFETYFSSISLICFSISFG